MIFGDYDDPDDPIQSLGRELEARRLDAPEAKDLKSDVRYAGLESFVSEKIHRGAQLDPRDEDPIYEQN